MPRDNHAELKRLQRQLSEASNIQAALLKEQANLQKKVAESSALVQKLQDAIEELKEVGGVIIVSEHALLRYLERVEGVDMAAVKEKILPLEVERRVLKCGNGTYPVTSGFKVCVSDGVVATILTPDLEKSK